MADISQVKLPNGDTYNLIDETSGYGKVHIVAFDEDNNTINTTYNQLRSWFEANEIIILKADSDYYYLDNWDSDNLYFYTLEGYGITINSSSIQPFATDGWLTLSDLPIYDGTVEEGYK